MKRLILVLSLGSAALLSACAQFQTRGEEGADAGATSVEDKRPYPKSSSDLGLF